MALVTPPLDAIAQVLIDTDGLLGRRRASGRRRSAAGTSAGRAGWPPTSRRAQRRERALGLARDAATPSRAYAAAEELVATAEAEA